MKTNGKKKTNHAGGIAVGLTLADDELNALEGEANRLGLPRATLIKHIIRKRYGLSSALESATIAPAKGGAR